MSTIEEGCYRCSHVGSEKALMTKLFGRTLAIGAVLAALTLPASASTIFDNTSNDLNTRFNPGTFEVGDQIIFGGTDRFLTDFGFEYFGLNGGSASNPFAGTVAVQVTLYNQNGPTVQGVTSPGTILYQSTPFNISTTERATLLFGPSDFGSLGGVTVPNEITWSVKFTGLGAGDTAGVDLYSLPTIGQDYPDYWQNDGTGWTLMTNSVPVDFASRFQATVVPEPTTMSLSVIGLGLLVATRMFRRK